MGALQRPEGHLRGLGAEGDSDSALGVSKTCFSWFIADFRIGSPTRVKERHSGTSVMKESEGGQENMSLSVSVKDWLLKGMLEGWKCVWGNSSGVQREELTKSCSIRPDELRLEQTVTSLTAYPLIRFQSYYEGR